MLKGKSTILLISFLALIGACSDNEARRSITSISNDIRLVEENIAALKDAKVEYGEQKFKLEDVTYQFSQDEFNPVLHGRATIIAVNGNALPEFARVEISYQVYTPNKELLVSGLVPVSLKGGRGEMVLQVVIPVMSTDAENVSIQLKPYQWYPVYIASPAS